MHAVAFDICHFDNALKKVLFINLAYTARHCAEVGECVAQNKSHHCIVRCATLQMLCQGAVTLGSVKIVRIDNRKGLADCVGGHQNCMHRAPWPGSTRGDGKPLRKFVEFLKGIFDCDTPFEPCADSLPKRLLDVLANNEYDLAKSGAESIIDRIIDE